MLRIEDTDQARLVEGAVEVIYKTLRECGLDHDEGPDVGGPVGPYVQTERRDTVSALRQAAWWSAATPITASATRPNPRRIPATSPARTTPAAIFPRKRCSAVLTPVCRGSSARRSPTRANTTFHDEIFGDITAPNADLDDQVLIKRDGLPDLQLCKRH